MKSKKLIAMVTALAVGGALLVSTGFAAMAQTSGYDLYKTAVKNTKDLKNATAQFDVAATDNGTSLIQVDSTIKMDRDKNAMSSTSEEKATSFDETHNFYLQDGKSIMKSSDSDVYTVNDHGARKMNSADNVQENTAVSNSVEAFVDAVVGDRQNKFNETENNDGTKTITLNLTADQITPIENAALNVVFSLSQVHRYNEDTQAKPDFKNIIPQLKNNIKFKEVDITAKIDSNNNIISQDAKIVVSGDDASAKTHEVVFDINTGVSNINSTVPDTVDLTGKNVKTITSGFHSRK